MKETESLQRPDGRRVKEQTGNMNAAQEQKDKKTLPAVKGREERREKNKQKQTNDICSSERTAVAARFRDLLPIEAEISKSCKKKRKSRKFQVTSGKVVRVRGSDQTSESPPGIRRQCRGNITRHLSKRRKT